MIKLGDIVYLKNDYPIWTISIGLQKFDIGMVVSLPEQDNIFAESEQMIKVFWFKKGKVYNMPINSIGTYKGQE